MKLFWLGELLPEAAAATRVWLLYLMLSLSSHLVRNELSWSSCKCLGVVVSEGGEATQYVFLVADVFYIDFD